MLEGCAQYTLLALTPQGESQESTSVHATQIVTVTLLYASVCTFLGNSFLSLLAGKLIQNMHSRNSGVRVWGGGERARFCKQLTPEIMSHLF